MTIAEMDVRWEKDRLEYGWVLPQTPRWKRFRGIRWCRWFVMNVRFQRHLSRCQQAGLGFFAQPYDEWRLYAIYRGWA